ncbi:MAG: signal peptidase I [Candidatus Eremiobacteraeota bacterium]|nr:signal peptidase I [Candidatus Eremiobacteraeota bacterium]
MDNLLGMILMGLSLACLVSVVVSFAAMWRLFTKAGRQGWEGIVPFYNAYVMSQFLRMPVWTVLLLFIPGVNFLAVIVFVHRLMMAFGKDVMWTIAGVIPFTSPFAFLALAFGDAQFGDINEFDMNTFGLK